MKQHGIVGRDIMWGSSDPTITVTLVVIIFDLCIPSDFKFVETFFQKISKLYQIIPYTKNTQ